jgi:hypothetical protein
MPDCFRILTLRAPRHVKGPQSGGDGGGGWEVGGGRAGGAGRYDTHIVFSVGARTQVLALNDFEFVPTALKGWDLESITLAVLATPQGHAVQV